MGAAVAAIHHGLFAWLQANELFGITCFMHPGIHMVVFHAIFVVAQTVILIYMALRMADDARAGAHGRGFAVVASEVRTLALRCENAAKDIRQLVSVSVECTRTGSQQVENAGQTMREVIGSINALAELVEELSDMSDQQSISITQMNDSIASIDESVQENVEHTAQTVQAARQQQQQADGLQQAISVFRLA